MIPVRRRKRTLARTVLHFDDMDGMLCCGLLVIVGAVVLTLSAKVQIPFWPVPVTLQTLVVLLIGVVFGLRLGIATVAVYLAEGAIGWPVFAGGGGTEYFIGPTGGFLIGFLVAAGVVGYLAEHGFDRKWQTALVVFLVGDAVLFAFGVAWLSYLYGFSKAISLGLLPFLLAEAVKITLAMAALPFAWKYIGRWY
jgi:biotin transport system substrate-specific component